MSSEISWHKHPNQHHALRRFEERGLSVLDTWSIRLGAILLLVSVVWSLYLVVSPALILPPAGYEMVEARVTSKMRRGTFMEPSFTIMLHYDSAMFASQRAMVVSSGSVDVETYWALEIGQTVPIFVSVDEPTRWQLVLNSRSTGDYVLLAVLLIGGLFTLSLPKLLRIGLRQDDFGY